MTKEEFLKEFKDTYDYSSSFGRCVNGKIVTIRNESEYADFPLTESGSFGLIAPEHDRYEFIPYGNKKDRELYEEADCNLYEFSKLLLKNNFTVFKLYCYEHSGFRISGYDKVDENTDYFDESEHSFYGIYYNNEGITKIDGQIEETNCWFEGSIYSITIEDENFDFEESEWFYGLYELFKAIDEKIKWDCDPDKDKKIEIKAFANGIINNISNESKIMLKKIIEG